MKLIPLDAVLAEINQRIKDYKSHKIDDSYHDGLIFALEDLRDDFLNTLEVKEVNPNDAFIEKAVGYFNSKLYDWVQITNPNQRSCANTIMKQDFIEDFRKYMEGE